MQAHFQMSAREFTGCMQAVANEATSKAMATKSFLCTLGPIVAVFATGALLNWSEDRLLHQGSWIIMLVCGLMIWGTFRQLQIDVMDSIVSEGGLHTQPTTVEISPETLIFSNCLSRTVLQWEAIGRIEETEQHLTIFIDNLVVQFIPKDAFSSEAEFRAFLDKARRWTDAASGPWAR